MEKKNRKQSKVLKKCLDSITEEDLRKTEREMSCKWYKDGGYCGKGLEGTICNIIGCVAWEKEI